MNHFVDIFVEKSKQIHYNYVYRKHVPKPFIVTCSNHVSNLLTIIIDCGPFFLVEKSIFNVCVKAKSHLDYIYIYILHFIIVVLK
jgi:hypothetical protein